MACFCFKKNKQMFYMIGTPQTLIKDVNKDYISKPEQKTKLIFNSLLYNNIPNIWSMTKNSSSQYIFLVVFCVRALQSIVDQLEWNTHLSMIKFYSTAYQKKGHVYRYHGESTKLMYKTFKCKNIDWFKFSSNGQWQIQEFFHKGAPWLPKRTPSSHGSVIP